MQNSLRQIEEPAGVSLSARWLRARAARNFDLAQSLALELIASAPHRTDIRRSLARQLEALGRHADAVPHWLQLWQRDASDEEAASHLGLRRSRPEAQCGGGFRHIAICGVSFCGSTLTDRLLGGLPGAANICESHWLTHARQAQGYGPIDFQQGPHPSLKYCAACGPQCGVLSMAFRRDLARDSGDWYRRIARRLGTEVLVSADKNPPKLVERDPLLRLDALVLFKSPQQAWLSALKRLPQGEGQSYYRQKCADYLAVWADRYSFLLDHFRPQGRTVFLDFADLARRPRETLAALCKALDLRFDASVLDQLPSRHSIGGNVAAAAQLAQAEFVIAPPAAENSGYGRQIEEAREAQEVFGRLRSASLAV